MSAAIGRLETRCGDAVLGLLRRETLEDKLFDETTVREGLVIKVFRCLLGRLVIPIGTYGVDAVGGILS